jgi:hypothetical protein
VSKFLFYVWSPSFGVPILVSQFWSPSFGVPVCVPVSVSLWSPSFVSQFWSYSFSVPFSEGTFVFVYVYVFICVYISVYVYVRVSVYVYVFVLESQFRVPVCFGPWFCVLVLESQFWCLGLCPSFCLRLDS